LSVKSPGLRCCCVRPAGRDGGHCRAGPHRRTGRRWLHFPAAETGFDPAIARDTYSAHVEQAIFETLYTYDYLARPARLVPLTATALPEVSADGKTYTIRLKRGIYFTPDPAFKGKRRELTMADYVYSWKRLFDPRLASGHAWLFQGKVVGLDKLAADASKNGRLDYDARVEGFELVDPYTLRIRLTRTDFNLGMILAHEPTAALAREVVAAYGDVKGEVSSNPVGTGYYKLGQWVRGNRIVLERNPDHLPETWDFKGTLRRAHHRPDEGQEDGPDRPHRNQRDGRGPVALAVVPGGGQTCSGWTARWRRGAVERQLRPELAARACSCRA
jgi:hypothetical protein